MEESQRTDTMMLKGAIAGGIIATAATAGAFLLRDRRNREKVMKTAREAVKTIKENPAIAGTVGAVIGKVGEMGGDKMGAEKMGDQGADEVKSEPVIRRGRPATAV